MPLTPLTLYSPKLPKALITVVENAKLGRIPLSKNQKLFSYVPFYLVMCFFG